MLYQIAPLFWLFTKLQLYGIIFIETEVIIIKKLIKLYYIIQTYSLKTTLKILKDKSINHLYNIILTNSTQNIIFIIQNNFSHNAIQLNKTQSKKFLQQLNISNNKIISLSNKYNKTTNKITNYINNKQYK